MLYGGDRELSVAFAQSLESSRRKREWTSTVWMLVPVMAPILAKSRGQVTIPLGALVSPAQMGIIRASLGK